MVRKGIILDHRVSSIEVDKAKVVVIVKLPIPTLVKDVWNFHGHAGFYRKFIKDFSKITKPFFNLLAKDVKFDFNIECIHAFQILQDNLIIALVMVLK